MENLQEILKKKRDSLQTTPTGKKPRPINMRWEVAREFGEYVGLSTPFVLKLFNLYGQSKVLGLRSYLADSQCSPQLFSGMVVNLLKGKK